MTSRYVRPAEQLEQDTAPPPRWLDALYIALILAAFAVAGHIDLEEAERIERERMERFVNAHHQVTSAADAGDPFDYGRERFPGLAVEVCR